MRIDWYTKAVLTVIAVALIAIAAEDYVLPAQAQSSVWVDGGSITVDGFVNVAGTGSSRLMLVIPCNMKGTWNRVCVRHRFANQN